MYDHSAEYEAVRPEILDALDSYGRDRKPLGGFLQAVVNNDFSRAVCMADGDNLRAIAKIARYVYNELPAACHGMGDPAPDNPPYRRWTNPDRTRTELAEFAKG